jgi:hypothetical protein
VCVCGSLTELVFVHRLIELVCVQRIIELVFVRLTDSIDFCVAD